MPEYLYTGPATGITLKGGKEVLLFTGRTAELPDCAEVNTLVAMKRLTPVATPTVLKVVPTGNTASAAVANADAVAAATAATATATTTTTTTTGTGTASAATTTATAATATATDNKGA